MGETLPQKCRNWGLPQGKSYLAGIKNENLVLIPVEPGYCKWDYYGFQFLAIVYKERGNETPSSFG